MSPVWRVEEKRMNERHSRPKPATAIDVANLAGVSQSAVSRAFTEGASISPKTRRKVLEAAQALNYNVNFLARSLITGKTNIVGITMRRLNQFNPQVLSALALRLREAGYGVLLMMADGEEQPEITIDDVTRYRIDALIVASTDLSSKFANQCRDAGIPILFFIRTTSEPEISSVTADNFHGGYSMAAFLVAGGHEDFSYISSHEIASPNQERERGFLAYFEKHGLPCPRKYVAHSTFEGSIAPAREMFRESRPSAIFALSDVIGMATLDVARFEFGLSDLSVVGFSNIPAAAWPSYSLTTYSQPVEAMMNATVDILFEVIRNPNAPVRHVTVPGKIIVRNSARLPATGIEEDEHGRTWTPSDP